ncbi:MAG: sugar ABC transporter ATP-binding protein [Rhodospirillales bacterium]|nr:sugar ABC transporter ATP-binding protein [Rhodospirillales bacterium]
MMSGSVSDPIGTSAGPAEEARSTPPLIELDGVVKHFGNVHALRGVHFDLRPGEVHALLGQNGAGKSTLIKIFAGVLDKDSGTIRIEGRETAFKSAAAARTAGVAVVYQELSLVPSMRVADNLFLAREPGRFGLVNRRKLVADARRFLEEQGLPLNPTARVEHLPFAYRQLTEIAKALSGEVRVLVLDEPTSSLSRGEEEILFDAVRKVSRQGVGVIYVTHRLEEVFKLSDRVTVLRDGANVGTFATSDVTMEQLVGSIVGPSGTGAASSKSEDYERAPPSETSQPVIELVDVNNDRLNGVNLAVQAGEVVGLAGMIGSGRTEILESIFGLRRIASGELRIDGENRKVRAPIQAIGLGAGLVPEDRHLQGLVLDHSIERNVALPRLDRLDFFGLFRRRESKARARAAINGLSIVAPSTGTRAAELSGGNQQKVVFGRWSDPTPRLLLLDEPTVGVDVGAREQIYEVVRTMVANGASALIVSSDLGELLMLTDRIAVVAGGRVVDVMPVSEIRNEEHLHQIVQEAQA